MDFYFRAQELRLNYSGTLFGVFISDSENYVFIFRYPYLSCRHRKEIGSAYYLKWSCQSAPSRQWILLHHSKWIKHSQFGLLYPELAHFLGLEESENWHFQELQIELMFWWVEQLNAVFLKWWPPSLSSELQRNNYLASIAQK